MAYSVEFTPEAQQQLIDMLRYIEANAADSDAGGRFVQGILQFCETLAEFPERARRRDDIRPGLHLTNYKRRAVIAYAFEASLVSIIGIFYAGRDYESVLKPADDPT